MTLKFAIRNVRSWTSLYQSCFMVKLELHSSGECYVHGIPDRIVPETAWSLLHWLTSHVPNQIHVS